MTEQNKKRKNHSEDHNVFTNYNSFLNHPCTLNISNIRIPAIYEIYKYISLWDESKLKNIPDTLVYLRLKKKPKYKENILLKSSMIEEQIHKHALSDIINLFNQNELNLNYYKCLNIYLEKIKSNKAFNDPFTIRDFRDYPGHYTRIKQHIDSIPDTDPAKSHLEMQYTMLSFFEYNLFAFVRISYPLVKFTKKQYSNMQRLSKDEFSKWCQWGNTIIHNGEYSNKAAKCAICIDAYADCMYSNCRHLCICYNCLLKLDGKNREHCIICRQHNDCIIQTLNP